MNVPSPFRDRLWRRWRACRNLLPEAVRWFREREPAEKRAFTFCGAASAVVLWNINSFFLHQLVAALFLFTVGFAALLAVTVFGMAVHWVTWSGATWARIRVPQGYRAGRNGMLEFAHSLRSVQVGPRWKQRVPAPAVPTTSAD